MTDIRVLRDQTEHDIDDEHGLLTVLRMSEAHLNPDIRFDSPVAFVCPVGANSITVLTPPSPGFQANEQRQGRQDVLPMVNPCRRRVGP